MQDQFHDTHNARIQAFNKRKNLTVCRLSNTLELVGPLVVRENVIFARLRSREAFFTRHEPIAKGVIGAYVEVQYSTRRKRWISTMECDQRTDVVWADRNSVIMGRTRLHGLTYVSNSLLCDVQVSNGQIFNSFLARSRLTNSSAFECHGTDYFRAFDSNLCNVDVCGYGIYPAVNDAAKACSITTPELLNHQCEFGGVEFVNSCVQGVRFMIEGQNQLVLDRIALDATSAYMTPEIQSPLHFRTISNMGRDHAVLQAMRGENGKLYIVRGCFFGTPEEFLARSAEQHSRMPEMRAEYKRAIAFLKASVKTKCEFGPEQRKVAQQLHEEVLGKMKKFHTALTAYHTQWATELTKHRAYMRKKAQEAAARRPVAEPVTQGIEEAVAA